MKLRRQRGVWHFSQFLCRVKEKKLDVLGRSFLDGFSKQKIYYEQTTCLIRRQSLLCKFSVCYVAQLRQFFPPEVVHIK